jgi:hypothetical protein
MGGPLRTREPTLCARRPSSHIPASCPKGYAKAGSSLVALQTRPEALCHREMLSHAVIRQEAHEGAEAHILQRNVTKCP